MIWGHVVRQEMGDVTGLGDVSSIIQGYLLFIYETTKARL